MQAHKSGPIPPPPEKLQVLATDLNNLLQVLGKRLSEFSELLSSPRSAVSKKAQGVNITHKCTYECLLLLFSSLSKQPILTTIGNQIPLGPERLKICELFAEILHLQYLYTSSPLFDRLVVVSLSSVAPDDESIFTKKATPENVEGLHLQNNILDELVFVTDCFVRCNVLPMCLVKERERLIHISFS